MKRIIFTLLLFLFSARLFATMEKKQLQLELRAQYGSYDQTTIYFDLGLSSAFIAAQDVPKVMGTYPGVPNIYSLSSDNVKCSENGYSALTQSAVIALGTLIDSTALYTFTLDEFFNFDSTTVVFLEDRKLNTFTEMQVNFYQVQLSPDDTTGRFFLHITSAVQFSPVTSGCANNNGAISVAADSTITWSTVALQDSNGSPITVYNNAMGRFNFNMLPEGNYTVAFNYNGYSASKSIFVNGNHITVAIAASSQNVAVGETIDFTSAAINTTEYVWEFGDSTFETGVANPTYFYYTAGIYTVSLTCSNSAGCMAEAQMTITVSESTGINTPAVKGINVINLGAKTIEVIMNNILLNNAELQVYNVLGQAIYSTPVTADEMQVSLANEPAGIYLVTVKSGNKSSTTKIYIN
jgi:PKD repeat protein